MRVPPLRIGDTFQTRTGPRKVYYKNDIAYFQHKQRRYLCNVQTVEHERYKPANWWRVGKQTRCQLTVMVINT
jgi:hypothetical protein